MRVIDFSHPIHENMPVFPGDVPLYFQTVADYPGEGYHVTQMTIETHVGTHIDPPAHVVAGGRTLDAFSVDHFIG